MPLPVCTRREPAPDRRFPLMAVAVLLTAVMTIATVSVWMPGLEHADAESGIEGGIQYELEENETVMRISPNTGAEDAGTLPNSGKYGSGMLWSVTKIIVSGDITKISSDSFSSFENLQEIDLSESKVTTIGDTSFSLSRELQTIVFPEDVKELHIGMRAFPCELVEEGGKVIYNIDDSSENYNPKDIIGYTFELESGKFVRQAKEAKEFTVTYKLGGDTTGPTPDVMSLVEGAEFEFAQCEATKEGFVFAGWNYLGDTHPAGYKMKMGNENIVLTAVWKAEAEEFTVTFYPNGGDWSEPKVEHYLSGESIDLGTITPPTRESYTFDGWSCGDRTYSSEETVLVLSDMTFTAQWKADGGSDKIAPVPIFPGDEQEAIEVVINDQKDDSWLGQNGKTIILLAIVAAIIAELAVLSISRRR